MNMHLKIPAKIKLMNNLREEREQDFTCKRLSLNSCYHSDRESTVLLLKNITKEWKEHYCS